MSIKRFDTYTAICDWPGCGADVMDPTDYGGWGNVEDLDETLSDYDWRIGVDGRHYCPEHPVAWASDPAQVDGMTPPYLLIHDGDTGDYDHDGKVSMVVPLTERLLAEGNEPIPEVTR